MATSIIPKSEVREEGKDNVIHGYAELPAIDSDEGQFWALPGNIKIFDRLEAQSAAKKLDATIRKNMKKTGRNLLH